MKSRLINALNAFIYGLFGFEVPAYLKRPAEPTFIFDAPKFIMLLEAAECLLCKPGDASCIEDLERCVREIDPAFMERIRGWPISI